MFLFLLQRTLYIYSTVTSHLEHVHDVLHHIMTSPSSYIMYHCTWTMSAGDDNLNAARYNGYFLIKIFNGLIY